MLDIISHHLSLIFGKTQKSLQRGGFFQNCSRHQFSTTKHGYSPFLLERYFDKYEFKAKYLLCSSDTQAYTMNEILKMGDKETLSLWNNLELSYTQAQGLPLLRNEIAKFYNGTSNTKTAPINENDILILAPEEGVLIGLNTISRHFSNQKQEAIVVSPSYQSLQECYQSTPNTSIKHWNVELNGNTNQWELNFQTLENQLLTNHTKLVIVNFPHNPTGYYPTLSQWYDLIKFCQMNDLYLFSDEMYWNLWDGQDTLPSASMLYDKAVTLSGLSKSYGCPGLRIGWLITRDSQLMNAFRTMKDYTTICNSAPSEILALIALRNVPTILSQRKSIIATNTQAWKQFCQKHSTVFQFIPNKGGSTCLTKLKGKAKQLGAFNFAELVVNECQVMLLPSNLFFYGNDFVRIGLGRTNFKDALHTLDQFLCKWK
ncbi:aminotransferase class I and II [Reticulomyxa filosa]|uniref:Aminotransferase class I and II n=1 Tax=Reticulomyxa filosa TaxID=46433 RepID=X6ML72_RETFI|nr:aminotransferase class I and II [Reticulomyxa filosa]|eukprot:ETO14763.1 aminotransferase class I and II [Reticulomyxa filosa]